MYRCAIRSRVALIGPLINRGRLLTARVKRHSSNPFSRCSLKSIITRVMGFQFFPYRNGIDIFLNASLPPCMEDRNILLLRFTIIFHSCFRSYNRNDALLFLERTKKSQCKHISKKKRGKDLPCTGWYNEIKMKLYSGKGIKKVEEEDVLERRLLPCSCQQRNYCFSLFNETVNNAFLRHTTFFSLGRLALLLSPSPPLSLAFYPCLSSLFCPSASRPLSATYLPVICGTLESRNSVPDRRLARRILPRFRANCLVPALISSSSPRIIVPSFVRVCVCLMLKGFFVSCFDVEVRKI